MIKGWKDLSHLEGQEVVFIKGYPQLTELADTKLPDVTIFLKDYPDTVLIDMQFIKDYWGQVRPARHIKKMIPKSALAMGDIILKTDRGWLVGREVGIYE